MNRIKKSLVTLLVLVMIGITPITLFADVIKTAIFSNDIGITINGTKYDARVVIIDGTSYLPIKVLGYAINAETEWDEKNRTVILTRKEDAVEVENVSQTLDGKLDKKKAYFSDDIRLMVDGEFMDIQVVIVEGRSYLPVKAVGENMGIRATWDDETRVIKIVNPLTVVVEDSIKDYYVYELPKIKEEEDYLIGNWKGTTYVKRNSLGSRHLEDMVFISKNNDGSYKIIRKTVTEDGSIGIWEDRGTYDKTNKLLYCENVKTIYSNTKWIADDYSCYLKNGVLSGKYGDTHWERF